jgi:hypothetical protein
MKTAGQVRCVRRGAAKFFVKLSSSPRQENACFCQVFPNISLAVLWDFKGLQGRNLLFAAFFESPNL